MVLYLESAFTFQQPFYLSAVAVNQKAVSPNQKAVSPAVLLPISSGCESEDNVSESEGSVSRSSCWAVNQRALLYISESVLRVSSHSLSPVCLPMAVPPVLCEPLLAFIKAFCLRSDLNTLKQAALSCFNISMLASTKKASWECCKDDLTVLNLPFTQRRSSEKHSQAAADLLISLITIPSPVSLITQFVILLIWCLLRPLNSPLVQPGIMLIILTFRISVI